MPDGVRRLQGFIIEQHIQADVLVFDKSTHSVAEAALVVGAAAEDFVKNICLIGSGGQLILAVVKGEDHVDRRKVGYVLGIPAPRLATPAEILDRTGYPCGGTPSFGFKAIFLIDERVLDKEIVFSGGGSENTLMRVSPAEIQRVNDARIAVIHA